MSDTQTLPPPSWEWEPVIGVEVHIQLSTQSKLFSNTPTTYGALPNKQASLFDIALPGTLPTLNEEAVRMAIKFGLSIQADIPLKTVFSRKNYFYPDLPKGYQISQFDQPIVGKGSLMIELDNGQQKTIGITRAHLEEDAGKSLHENLPSATGIDLNRAGVPLLEIVSDPDLRSSKETVCYLKSLHKQVCYLDICDGNLQEGSFRADVNVSVRRVGETALGTRVEIKNLNSFRFAEKAIDYEINRQISLIKQGAVIQQETRLYDPDKHVTSVMRGKEEAAEYRYFQDPDLCPLMLTQSFITEIQALLPELPKQKQTRFQTQYTLTRYDADLLTTNRALADYFETVVSYQVSPKLAANWINGELMATLNREGCDISQVPIEAERLAGLLHRIEDGTISANIAKAVFTALWDSMHTADQIISQQGLRQVTDASAMGKLIQEILTQYPQQLQEYHAGKEALFGFFFGKIMKASGGKFNPQQLNKSLKESLKRKKCLLTN